jgi:hypothetical protein
MVGPVKIVSPTIVNRRKANEYVIAGPSLLLLFQKPAARYFPVMKQIDTGQGSKEEMHLYNDIAIGSR